MNRLELNLPSLTARIENALIVELTGEDQSCLGDLRVAVSWYENLAASGNREKDLQEVPKA